MPGDDAGERGRGLIVPMGPVNDFAPIPCNLEPAKGLKQGGNVVVLNLF